VADECGALLVDEYFAEDEMRPPGVMKQNNE
jgi:hypothetical protein